MWAQHPVLHVRVLHVHGSGFVWGTAEQRGWGCSGQDEAPKTCHRAEGRGCSASLASGVTIPVTILGSSREHLPQPPLSFPTWAADAPRLPCPPPRRLCHPPCPGHSLGVTTPGHPCPGTQGPAWHRGGAGAPRAGRRAPAARIPRWLRLRAAGPGRGRMLGICVPEQRETGANTNNK